MNKNYLKIEVISLWLVIIILIFSLLVQAKDTRDTPQLTSLEAAALAYQEARKWDHEAVLWYINPPGRELDYHWGENDLSWEWQVIFVRPRDDKSYYIKIVDNQIVSIEEGGEFLKRLSPILPSFPKDRPGISMQEAAQVAFAAGAPSWDRANVCYIIDNWIKAFQGKAVWYFLFGSQFSSYTIDGLTGELLAHDYFDPETLKKISPEEVKYEFYPDKVDKIKEENFIYDFFEAVDQKNFKQVFSMMDENFAGDKNMQEMWKANFSSLEKIKVIRVYPEEEQKWPNHQPLYEVNIYTISKPGSPYCGWDEGRNIRWITVATEEDNLKIVSIATGP
ncbi:MAG: hypothetical protein IMZ56_00665 [Candidatus Atribacteria bacterium]|nr:hypothetical protein [Candidatus Atribacteria bacterium]